MRITVPDEVADTYIGYAEGQGATPEALMVTQLRRFRALEPGKKAIVVQPALLDRFEERVGGPPIVDGADLMKRLEGIAQITFESIPIRLTEGQRAELVHRAERQGRTVEDLVRAIVGKISSDFFYATGGGPAAEGPPGA